MLCLLQEKSLFARRASLSRSTLMFQAKDTVRIELSRLLTYFLSPNTDLPNRLYATELLANESKMAEMLKILVKIDSTVSQGYKVFNVRYK